MHIPSIESHAQDINWGKLSQIVSGAAERWTGHSSAGGNCIVPHFSWVFSVAFLLQLLALPLYFNLSQLLDCSYLTP